MTMLVAIVSLETHKQVDSVELSEWYVHTSEDDRAREVHRAVGKWAQEHGCNVRKRGDDDGDLYGWTRGKMVSYDDEWTWEGGQTLYAWMVLPDM